jgi:hypothetical protein
MGRFGLWSGVILILMGILHPVLYRRPDEQDFLWKGLKVMFFKDKFLFANEVIDRLF